MLIEPQAFWTLFGGTIVSIVGALVYVFKSSSDTRNKVVENTATSRNTQQTTATDAIANTLASVVVLLKDAIDNLAKANEIASKERGDTSVVLREMMGHINGVYSVIKVGNEKTTALALSIDDMEREVAAARVDIGDVKTVASALGADIEENFTSQIGPVVSSIQVIGKQLEVLNTTLQSKDEATIRLMEKLQFSFGALETTLLKMLEPIALKAIGEITHEKYDNGKSADSIPSAE